MKKLNWPAKLIAGIILSATSTFAESGSLDMWTGLMGARANFTLHENYCDTSTETFVEVVPAGSSGSPAARGYCIELNTRSTATWVIARHTCLSAGKRLPEVAEYQHACINIGSLSPTPSNMPNSSTPEWTDNFLRTFIFEASSNYGATAHASGLNNCYMVTVGQVGNQSGGSASVPYRCVR